MELRAGTERVRGTAGHETGEHEIGKHKAGAARITENTWHRTKAGAYMGQRAAGRGACLQAGAVLCCTHLQSQVSGSGPLRLLSARIRAVPRPKRVVGGNVPDRRLRAYGGRRSGVTDRKSRGAWRASCFHFGVRSCPAVVRRVHACSSQCVQAPTGASVRQPRATHQVKTALRPRERPRGGLRNIRRALEQTPRDGASEGVAGPEERRSNEAKKDSSVEWRMQKNLTGR